MLFELPQVAAQTPYYQGKTIRMMVGYPAGSAHDMWGRLVAPQLTKHIPGNPATVVENSDRRRLHGGSELYLQRRQA